MGQISGMLCGTASCRHVLQIRKILMRLTRTIAFKLFLVICLVQTAILGLLTFAIIRVQESSLMEHVMQSADQVSDMIARSTRYSMMLNRKEDVHEIIASVGGQPGIEGIRIYNKPARWSSGLPRPISIRPWTRTPKPA